MKPLYLRVLLWCFIHSLYRIQVMHPDRIPSRGGALLVSNHVSLIDVLLILASTHRFVRFLLPDALWTHWWLRPWLRLLRAIPQPDESRPEELDAALQKVSKIIEAGEVVGIFAERNISRIGILLPFRTELEQIMKGLIAPIIPACLDGVWGSIFSFQAGRFLFKFPRRVPYPLAVSFGPPMTANSTAVEVRAAVQLLNTEAWVCRRRTMRPLGRAFVKCARKHPFRFAMADARVPKLSFSGVLMKTIFLARRLTPHWQGQKTVGVFLPPSVGGALVNLAVLLSGRVPVNLNYTVGAETLASCAEQAELRTIISSKAFLDKVKLSLPCRTVLLEDAAAAPKTTEKIAALALAWLAPLRMLEKAAGCERTPSLDDLAVLVFSSGSTGDPKGVMLSHYNLNSNIQQLTQVFNFRPEDRFLGILPFFHSFGMIATLLAPALESIGVVFHPNPLEPKAVGDLARRYSASHLMATPVFLQLYLRTCERTEFASLRLVLAGAEKLQDRLATAFEEKFGIRPVEGYGCTECSPAVAVNTNDFQEEDLAQVGSRRGSIGHPLPGVSVKVVDPDTAQPLPCGQTGLLFVRGPNVMQGYLNKPERTAEVLRDGWYNTGDIAFVSEDGFIRITDRMSRFSKIAGEMVPHILIEEKLHQLAGVNEQVFVVTGVPDDQKGERLIVLHKLAEPALATFVSRLPELDLPRLWVPKANQFIAIEQIPTLGTGKLDLRAIRQIATTRSSVPERTRVPA